MVRAVGNERLAGQLPTAALTILGLAVFINRLAFPEGEQHFTAGLFIFLGDIERILRASCHSIQLLTQPAPCNVGREAADTGTASGVTNDQLVVLNHQRRGFAAFTERLGAQLNSGQAGIFLHDLGLGQGRLNGDRRTLLHVVILQLAQTLCHTVGDAAVTGGRAHAAGRGGIGLGDLT